MPNILPYSWVTKTLTERVPASPYLGYNWGNNSGTDTVSGTIDNIYDTNTGTYRMYQGYHSGDGNASRNSIIEANWGISIPVTSVYYNMYLGTYGGNYRSDGNGGRRLYVVSLKISGTWTEIYRYVIKDSKGSNTWGYESVIGTISTGWNNVTGARMEIVANSYSYEGDRKQYIQLYLKEFTVNANLASGGVQII